MIDTYYLLLITYYLRTIAGAIRQREALSDARRASTKLVLTD